MSLKNMMAEVNQATTTGDMNALQEAYIQIAKQLVTMTDDLPVLTQCMIDVNAGTYNPSVAAVIASGGKVEAAVDPATGQPLKILVADSTLLDPKATLTLDDATTIQLKENPKDAKPADTTPAPEDVAAANQAISDLLGSTGTVAITPADVSAITAAAAATITATDSAAVAIKAATDASVAATKTASDADAAASKKATDSASATSNAVNGAVAAATNVVDAATAATTKEAADAASAD